MTKKKKTIIICSALVFVFVSILCWCFTPSFIVKTMAYAKKDNVIRYLEDKYSEDFVIVSVDEYEQDTDGFWPVRQPGNYTFQYFVRSNNENFIHKVICYQKNFKHTYIDSYYADKLFRNSYENKIDNLFSDPVFNYPNTNISHTTTPVGLGYGNPNNNSDISITYDIKYYIDPQFSLEYSRNFSYSNFRQVASKICNEALNNGVELAINVNIYFSDTPLDANTQNNNKKAWFYYDYTSYSDYEHY